MAFKPTAAQEKAIYSKENTLVSAAAGSGKTAVLVQRVIDRLTDCEDPLMADRMLVVTFTNAAAAELKLRIEKKLNEALDSDPYNHLLQRQKILLSSAKISTIDTFCMNFVRDNFDKAGIDPSFKIVDNSDFRMIMSASLSKLLNDQFNASNKEFLELLEYIGSDYDDKELSNRILDIYSYSRKMPYPEKWILKVVKSYEDFAEGKDNSWFTDAVKIVIGFAREAKILIQKAVSALQYNEVAFEKYSDNILYFSDFADRIIDLCEADDWDGIYYLIKDFAPPAMKSLSAKYKSEESEYAKAQRDAAQKLLSHIFKLVYGNREMLRNEISASIPHIKKIAELVIGLSKLIYSELLGRGLMTFDMVEQTALELITEYKDGEIGISPDADEYISAYDAVLVDEYQDTNDLQDTLFNALSDNQRKLFCVGDAKQSIYRFRGANPHNFIEKKKIYQDESSDDSFGLRVDLSGNFRSRPEICDYVNRLFSFIMHEDTADIEYDDKEKLEALAEFPENSERKVEHHFIDLAACSLSEVSDHDFDDIQSFAEGNVIARIIKDTVNAAPFIKCENGLRKAKYSDIAVLMRSPSVNGAAFSKILREHGIPVTLADKGIFTTDEVVTLLSLLRVINNPFDDISLLTVLTSPLFGFTIDELAEMRGRSKNGKLISAITIAASLGNIKADLLLKDLSSYRQMNVTSKVCDLIDRIFDNTNFVGIVSRLPEGELKKANLMTLRNLALSFESEGKRSLREFLRMAEEASDKDVKAEVPYSGDSVRISTIHSSKGLQYPVCILADTDHQFNFTDCYASLLTDEHYGFSFKYADSESNERSETLLRVLMSEYEKEQLMAEEIRLLYVALTRAEEKLVITSCFKDLKKKISDLADMGFVQDRRMRTYSFKSTKSYSDWILAEEFITNGDKYMGYLNGNTNVEGIHTHFETADTIKNVVYVADEDIERELIKNYSYEYPFSELLSVEAKASVTDIIHKADESKYQFTAKPAFMSEGGMNAAERGTATHKFMQFCDYPSALASVKDECERLYEAGFLTCEEAQCVNKEAVQTFFESELYKRISCSKHVRREMNFLSEFPASYVRADLDQSLANEKIIVQGAVDLLFEEDDGVVIVDFKTDRNKNEDELKASYSEQLTIYGKASEQILKKKVKQLIIYSFTLGKSIDI